MRHNKKRGMKLGTDASHTKAMKKSLIVSLLANDRIKTLEPRAKAIRGDVDRVITWAKKGDLHSRRLAIAKVGDKEVVREVFDKAAQGMWADRNGGYAEVVIIELVTEPVAPKAAKTSVKKVEKVAEKVEKTEEAEKVEEAPAEEATEAKAEETDAE